MKSTLRHAAAGPSGPIHSSPLRPLKAVGSTTIDDETGDDDAINGQTGEDRVAVAIIFVIRVGLDGNVSALVGRAVDFDQLRRIFHRERPQHGRIDEAVDRAIGSDAERNGNDGQRGKAGFPDELAKAKPNRQPRLTLSATKD